MPLYSVKCCECHKPRRNILHPKIVTTGTCVKMEKPCKCGNQRFQKTTNDPVSHTPGLWR